MTTKITTRTGGFKSRAEFIAAADECAELIVQLRQVSAEQDAAHQKVREQYGPDVESLTNRAEALKDKLALYASMHQEEVLDDGLRSGSSPKARFGFRLGNPTLVLLNSRHKWKTVCAAILAKGEEFAKRFLKVTDPKPDKDALKAQLDEAQLAELGCRVEQVDAFYLEAKDDTANE